MKLRTQVLLGYAAVFFMMTRKPPAPVPAKEMVYGR